jgi:hypothetical protein
MIRTDTVTLGSDAEVILNDATGRPFPACGIFGGTKDNPKVLTPDGIAVQEDNVLLEFNVPVSKDKKSWMNNLERSLRTIAQLVPPTMYMNTESCTAEYEEQLLNNPQAQLFGCDPDLNAWDGTRNPRPQSKNKRLRSAAAHVHIGWEEPNDEDRFALIRAADIFVVLPSISESRDRKRRELYGKAGAFRMKEYGVEHRVLDNYWIFNPVNRERVFDRYFKAIDFVNKGGKISKEDGEKIQKAINSYDGQAAKELLLKFSGKKEKEAKIEQYTKQYMFADPAVAAIQPLLINQEGF